MGLTACSNPQNQTPADNTAATTPDSVTPIVFWYSLSGELGERVQELVDQFNAQNPEYRIEAVYKGSYAESMNAGIAAYRAGQAPDILQVFEVGTATMMNAGSAIKPVSQMAQEAGNPLDPNTFVGAVASYYSDASGQLISMPFNSSTPVLYYNKDLYAQAGLPDRAPSTYSELKADARTLADAGFCGYTTTWPTWVLVENFAALHNIPYASQDNGFGGLDARIQLEQPLYQRLFSDLATMTQDGSFRYGGRADDANSLFVSGECGIFTGSSGSRAQIVSEGQFEFGVGMLPHYADAPGAPQNTIIGGASLWVFEGKDPAVYQGITEFFHYLSQPEVAAKWHQDTGYVPVVTAAYDLSKQQGYYEQNLGTEVAVRSLLADTTAQSRGVRLGNLAEIRDIEESYMERIFNGSMSVPDAIAAMQREANEVLARFERDHS